GGLGTPGGAAVPAGGRPPRARRRRRHRSRGPPRMGPRHRDRHRDRHWSDAARLDHAVRRDRTGPAPAGLAASPPPRAGRRMGYDRRLGVAVPPAPPRRDPNHPGGPAAPGPAPRWAPTRPPRGG